MSSSYNTPWIKHKLVVSIYSKTETIVNIYIHIYRVVQKHDTKFYFWDNLDNSAPILTIRSLLQAEIYGA